MLRKGLVGVGLCVSLFFAHQTNTDKTSVAVCFTVPCTLPPTLMLRIGRVGVGVGSRSVCTIAHRVDKSGVVIGYS